MYTRENDLELKKQFLKAIDDLIADCEERGDFVQALMLQVQQAELEHEIQTLVAQMYLGHMGEF